MTENWINLCTDGAVKAVTRTATFGGVLRFGNGVWIMGYNRSFGNCLDFYVKLWGILDGLTLIQDKLFEGVMIEADSLE
ncbi:hypothetical protein Gorai_002892, partial [Gossypium raimondii]|nr:hypothetical protein [Gossypium raimondii]